MKMWLIFVTVCLLFSLSNAADPLELLNIDPDQISVSGISSGACMASQVHVAFSADMMGVGMVAGAPYYCAQDRVSVGVTDCMENPDSIDVSTLRAETEAFASRDLIDDTPNMSGDRVWVFAGQSDSAVNPGIADKVAEYYSSYTTNIVVEKDINAEHTFPTVNKGNPCLDASSPYIGRCDYDGAFEMLNTFYGSLTRPDRESTSPLTGTFREFDQAEFFEISLPSQSSMDREGYVYIPEACQQGELCRLHIALHGCLQGKESVGDTFARDAGYNEVGEVNNIVILYPQAISSLALPLNPLGCWDWWGYNLGDYATKNGPQVLAIGRMVDKIAGTSLDPGRI